MKLIHTLTLFCTLCNTFYHVFNFQSNMYLFEKCCKEINVPGEKNHVTHASFSVILLNHVDRVAIFLELCFYEIT